MINKVVEVQAQSSKGWDEAAQAAIDEASKSVRNIESIYIREFYANVENDKITKYRVNAKVTFRVKQEEKASLS